jgi:hypothetical protein
MYVEEWQADIAVSVDGTPIFDRWATASGGVLTSSDSKTRAGGMGDEQSCGGPASRSDLTCTIQLTDIVAAQHRANEQLINHDAQVSITWLDLMTKAPIPGSTFTRLGKVKEFSEPNGDHSSNAVGMYTFIMSCHEAAA